MNNNNMAILNVINEGLSLMRSSTGVTEQHYQIWLDYSRRILSMIVKNPNILINYQNVIISAADPSLTPLQRLSMCLRYLINIQHIL